MAGGKEKEKIMLNMSDLQTVVTEHERKTEQNKNTTKDVNGRFHAYVHTNICSHMLKSAIKS